MNIKSLRDSLMRHSPAHGVSLSLAAAPREAFDEANFSVTPDASMLVIAPLSADQVDMLFSPTVGNLLALLEEEGFPDDAAVVVNLHKVSGRRHIPVELVFSSADYDGASDDPATATTVFIEEHWVELKPRSASIPLPIEFLELCRDCDVAPERVLASFIADLCDLDGTNGSDERMYADQYFERCGYRFMAETDLS